MKTRRVVQGASLTAFLVLLGLATWPLVPKIPFTAFLDLDPTVAVLTSLAARTLAPSTGLVLLLLGLTAILGRFFCGWLCPLGVTVDLLDRARGSLERPSADGDRRLYKYGVLLFVLVAATLGVSLAPFVAPVVLATRFYALLAWPAALLASEQAVTSEAAEAVGLGHLAYSWPLVPRYALAWLTAAGALAFGALVFLGSRAWYRYLCPAGALFALAGRRPLVRRCVSSACTGCGACRRTCPTRAIGQDGRSTDHAECILCQRCVAACPSGAVAFLPSRLGSPASKRVFSPGRRVFAVGGLSGLAVACVSHANLRRFVVVDAPGSITPPDLLRPPGSRPEPSFLARCVQCGACIEACPTNALQPTGLARGPLGLYTPRLVARRGACLADCRACGEVCPTDAIRSLIRAEKPAARIGTARIFREACVAWEEGRACLVCDEFCSYDAIRMERENGKGVLVPVVDEARCTGCGLCEFNCPVEGRAAIRVEPRGAIRLDEGSFREEARKVGHRYLPRPPSDPQLDEGELPPGFVAAPEPVDAPAAPPDAPPPLRESQ